MREPGSLHAVVSKWVLQIGAFANQGPETNASCRHILVHCWQQVVTHVAAGSRNLGQKGSHKHVAANMNSAHN